MNTGLRWTLGIALAGVLHHATGQQPDAGLNEEASKTAVQVCSACHGPGGDGTNPMFPKLAAQQAAYLESQVRAFRVHERSEPDAQHFMWGPSTRMIDERLIAAIASYYAGQPPPKGVSGDPARTAKGKELFHQGSAAHQIPPCASCHGNEAKGNDIYPRLAGQHSEYTLKQLRIIQLAVRKAPVMHGIITNMSDEEMRAVAIYLQSLN